MIIRSLLFILLITPYIQIAAQSKVWSVEAARQWFAKEPWRVGANFLPSTAINQLEMWQAETFDAATIDRELGWASRIGMNVMRVYLHDLAWKADAAGFKQRMNAFLGIADKHRIRILFTLLDDCWNPEAATGLQPAPKPGVHNSGWVRSPTKAVHDDPAQWGYLREYVLDVLRTFKDDPRIYLWDLYNEPANSGYGLSSLSLMQRVFEWAWEVRPSQPLSCGVWFDQLPAINEFQIRASDVITFHNYSDTVSLKKMMDTLLTYGRPLICTEYMARTNNSLFLTHLPILKRYGVPAINWGLVSGKSNTIFPWGSKEGSPEPAVWFHDVFRSDGTPYNASETKLIRELTSN